MSAIHTNIQNFDILPDADFVSAPVLKGLLGVSGTSTLWKWEQAGRIPKSTRLAGSKMRAWNVGELRRFAAEAMKAAK